MPSSLQKFVYICTSGSVYTNSCFVFLKAICWNLEGFSADFNCFVRNSEGNGCEVMLTIMKKEEKVKNSCASAIKNDQRVTFIQGRSLNWGGEPSPSVPASAGNNRYKTRNIVLRESICSQVTQIYRKAEMQL